MSGGLLFRHAVATLNRFELPSPAQAAVLATLEANRRGLQFVYEAGVDAGLERTQLCDRGAAILFVSAATQVTDDVADGDCDYLPRPMKDGPTAEWVLLNLFYATAGRLHLPPDLIKSIGSDLVCCGGAQFLELATTRWDLELSQRVAVGFAGRQLAAYLSLLWFGTPLASLADRVGQPLGIAVHISADVSTGDARFTTLPPSEREALLDWALEGLETLAEHRISSVDALTRSVVQPLRKYRQST